jgi:DMSO/TMAO reductase YedYZ molybdopterin-dependent catalytic subunit
MGNSRITPEILTRVSRRDWLRMSLITGMTVVTGVDRLWWPPVALAHAQVFQGGKKIDDVDFVDEHPFEMNTVIGTELDGRLYTDLSSLNPEHPITPTRNFYIRTCVSKLLEDDTRTWTIRFAGLAPEKADLSLARLTAVERPMGVHLMECVGNQRACHFGLMSAASWAGVELSDILNTVRIRPRARHVLVSGFDRYQAESVSSIPGASWIFQLQELKDRGAFLATRMNGEPLSRDHGAPVRLIVPGWYGCACIKWVNEIAFVPDNAPATAQMKEYAERTGQPGIPDLARDYLPAAMEYAATPIRIERWSIDGVFKYRVVGLLWGGSTPVKKLEIRFNPDEKYVPVDQLDAPGQDSWRFWTHAWVPRSGGAHRIQLRVKDPVVQAKRLDSGYHVRTVVI